MKERVLFSWSGGKDSAFALYKILQMNRYEIASLLTTITEDYGRVSMHGIQRHLLERQARSLDIPLESVLIPKRASQEAYDSAMLKMLLRYRDAGVTTVVFGDIFLEEVRAYREKRLSGISMKALFPLWKDDTSERAHAFIDNGFKAVVTCVDTHFLNGEFTGRLFDREFLRELPAHVDPCGENGEFHSFVFDGPIFKEGVGYRKGEMVLRDNRFYYCDIVPVK